MRIIEKSICQRDVCERYGLTYGYGMEAGSRPISCPKSSVKGGCGLFEQGS